MAITPAQATAAARAHLDAEPLPGPDYRWVLPPAHPVSDGWYFDYSFERTDGRPLSDADAVAGAPGFLVSAADGRVRVVGWAEYGERQLGVGAE